MHDQNSMALIEPGCMQPSISKDAAACLLLREMTDAADFILATRDTLQ